MSNYRTDPKYLKADALLDEIGLVAGFITSYAEERDRLIREALSSGLLTAPQIAAVTGLTRQRVYQIRDGRR